MIKQRIFTGWHFMRWFRLGIGIFILIQSFQMQDLFAGVFGIFILFQALSNTGCCGSSGCYTSTSREGKSLQEEVVELEEIKVKS